MKSTTNVPTEASSYASPQERRVERAIRDLNAYRFSDSSEVYGVEACSVYTPSGNRYTVHSDFCSCKDHENRGHLGIICKHRIAAMLAGYVKPTSVDVNACADGDEYAAKIKAEGAERLAARLAAAAPHRPTDEAELREWEEMNRAAALDSYVEAQAEAAAADYALEMGAEALEAAAAAAYEAMAA